MIGLLIGITSMGLVLLILWVVVAVPPILIDVHQIKDRQTPRPGQRAQDDSGWGARWPGSDCGRHSGTPPYQPLGGPRVVHDLVRQVSTMS
jgi:hypothetical protein